MPCAVQRFKPILSVTAALLLLSASAIAQADAPAVTPEQGDTRPSGMAMAADLVLARPLGLVASVIGTALFLVALPVEALSGDVGGPGRRLVVEPLSFTFTRPLGELY